MYRINRTGGVTGRNKLRDNSKTSGTIALMCPSCYHVIYINGSYGINLNYGRDNIHANIAISYRCDWCFHPSMVTGIELDPNIAEAISQLNKKGYYTEWCCEGHTYDNSTPYIQFKNSLDESIKLPKTWKFDSDSNRTIIRSNLNKYSKTKILEDLYEWVDNLEEKKSHIGFII